MTVPSVSRSMVLALNEGWLVSGPQLPAISPPFLRFGHSTVQPKDGRTLRHGRHPTITGSSPPRPQSGLRRETAPSRSRAFELEHQLPAVDLVPVLADVFEPQLAD